MRALRTASTASRADRCELSDRNLNDPRLRAVLDAQLPARAGNGTGLRTEPANGKMTAPP
jgi:hypothetical protein